VFEYHGWVTLRSTAEAVDPEPDLDEAAIRPGSYGLLHVLDDEHPEHRNHARVFRMVRGRVTEHPEPLLSPCIPTLEDEWVEPPPTAPFPTAAGA